MSQYMRQALQLARQGEGAVSPNPMVGCVIERDGEIVGSGWHKGAGQPHAEIEALREAGALAQNANVYVNLEPCAHFGKTPPCVDALIQAKVKSVHIPFLDPNPLVHGKGVEKLKQHGIAVFIGEEKALAWQLNEIFLHYIIHKTPFVMVKWAMTLDGKIATQSGHSKWITGTAARAHAHQLRHCVDAIVVGANTVLTDNPRLTVRLPDMNVTKQPLRIVLDGLGKVSPEHSLFQSNTLVVTSTRASDVFKKSVENGGAELLVLQSSESSEINLDELLIELGRREITSLLVEGGAKTLGAFFQKRLVHKVYAYVAPKIMGDAAALSPLSGASVDMINAVLPLQFETMHRLGDDYVAISYPAWEC